MKKNKVLFGTDPEAFAVIERDGKPFAVPPYYFREVLGVPATDDLNHPVFIESTNFKAHEDGAAFEFSIMPSHDPRELYERVQEGAKEVSDKILSQFPDHCLSNLQFLPSVGWDVNRWVDMPEDFFMSTRFGCDPDEDAFNLDEIPTVEDASLHPWRYAGGHIHVSGSKKIAEDPDLAVKCMAISVGNAATAFSDVPELEYKRLYRYGKPGKFRVQNYGSRNPFGKLYAVGMEYRTPSCRWLSDWNIAREVLKWAEIGIKNLLETGLGEELVEELSEPTIRAILSADQDTARQLLSHIESRI